MTLNEKLISEIVNENGTISRKYTANRINLMFVLSVIIPVSIVISIVYWRENPLQLCQNSYMKATNEITRYNEDNPKYTISLPKYNCNDIISTWTVAPAISGVPPKIEKLGYWESEQLENNYLHKLHDKVCNTQINSPLCKNYKLFSDLYVITEERLQHKNFFPILIGITNAESSLGLNFANDKVGGKCSWRNNWGGIKYQINDNNTRFYSYHNNWFLYWEEYSWRFVDQYGCNLFPFSSIEDYWITKINGMRYWYKNCINSNEPVKCISFTYVGKPNVSEKSWVNNVSIFLID